MTIEAKAHARAGLLGNPSDGYFGKTISIAVGNFSACVSLEQTERLRIETRDHEPFSYESVEDLARQVSRYGYYGAERLLKAAMKKFHDYCIQNQIELEHKNFTLRVQSSIPRQVGLGGSSAIVTAAMLGLMKFFDVDIPLEVLPSLTLDAEKGELGINAGLQDRVIQAYGGCLYMDFNRELMEKNNCGAYERLDPNLLPPLFLAYKEGLGKVSGHALNPITIGYERGDKLVLDCLGRIAEIAEEGKQALVNRDLDRLFALMNENFDQRSKIMPISEGNREMIETARNLGASAKFAGSGGSVIGMYKDDDMYEELFKAFRKIDALVIKPAVI
jgi:glucuronokinase